MNALRLLAGVSVMLLAAAAGLLLAPLRAPSAAPPPEARAETAAPDMSAFAGMFDLSALPQPQAREPVATPAAPPPDPGAGLRRYRFIGLAASDARAAGVFERDGATLVLASGESLEGFVLKRVGGDGAAFVNGADLEINLALEQAPGE